MKRLTFGAVVVFSTMCVLQLVVCLSGVEPWSEGRQFVCGAGAALASLVWTMRWTA